MNHWFVDPTDADKFQYALARCTLCVSNVHVVRGESGYDTVHVTQYSQGWELIMALVLPSGRRVQLTRFGGGRVA